jgi:folate-binding protein YgfZ
MLGSPDVARIEGRDARRFCNGMFTNNVRDLPVGGCNRHAIVDDRGRVGGFLDLHCESDERFLAVLQGLTPDAFAERYAKFIVFDDVEIEAVEGLGWLTVQGPHAAAAMRAAGLVVPEAGRFSDTDGVRIWSRSRAPDGGYDILLPAGSSALDALAPHAPRVDAATLETLRVLAGDPRYPDDTGEKRLPHELGLRDVLLSFEKGCYIGQETINRVDVMGQVRKHLVAVRVQGTAHAGAEVVLERSVGTLTSPVVLPDGATLGLAVLKEPAHVPGTAVTVGGAPGEVLALPVRV